MYGNTSQSPVSSRPTDSGRSTTSKSTTNGVPHNGYASLAHGTVGYVTSPGPLAGVNPLGTALLHPYAPASHHAPKSHLTPTAFQGRKLRSGKWIKEEEDYAELLIRLFERGHVKDCENGCTLRSFLSRKLHCAPMRISKKYAGKGIGKMVFLSKLNEGISTGEEHKATAASVKATEEKFYRAVFPGSEYQHGPFKAFTRESTVAGAATGPLLPGILPARFPFQIPVFNPENFSKPMLPVIAPTPTPIPTIGSGSVPTRVQQAPETAPTNVTPPVDQAKLLHQSYMNALKQKSSAPVAAAATSQAQSTQHAQASSSMGAGVRPPMPAPTGHTNVPSSEPSVHPRGSAPPKTNELPDFLTGFDKVTCIFKHGAAQGTATTDAPPTVGIPPYSPPFTSRSFDDFHRFLGKGLCPLDETVDQKTSSSSTRDPQQPHSSLASTAQTSQSILEIDTMALFTAESYAMFAQESAMAASQHAAYFQPGDAGFASRTHSLEAEGLMNVISDQIEDRQRYANQQNVQPEPSQANSLAGACISSNGLTPVERLYGTRDMNVVSGSEPSSSATETESNSLSMHGSSSDRDVSDNTSNDFATDNALSSNDSEGSSSDYQSDDSPQRKKLKRTTMTVEKRERGAERS